jgi:hypothetical protein
MTFAIKFIGRKSDYFVLFLFFVLCVTLIFITPCNSTSNMYPVKENRVQTPGIDAVSRGIIIDL